MSLNFRTLGMATIGNEILTGKIIDKNGPLTLKLARQYGIDVGRIVIIPDLEKEIHRELEILSKQSDFIITSGGIGYTHDDITFQSVANFLGMEMATYEPFWNYICKFYPQREPASLKKFAWLPKGVEAQFFETKHPPIFCVGNIYLLPGIPDYFNWQMEEVLKKYQGDRLKLKVAIMKVNEGRVSKYLGEIEAENLGLSIGSYPFQKKNGEFCCRITFESRDLDLTETGLTKFLSQIPEDWVEDIRESYPSGKELDV